MTMPAAKSIKPSSGQSARPVELAIEDLNDDQRAVYSVLRPDEPRTIRELAELAFENKPTAFVANYRVRNALRLLPRARLTPDSPFLARRVSPGRYVRGDGDAATFSENDVTTAAGRAPRAPTPPRSPTTSRKKVPHDESPSRLGGAPTRKQLVARVRELRDAVGIETVPEGEHAQRLALILVAMEAVGPSTTAIAKLTEHSRGYVIRRLAKVKGRLPKKPTPGLWQPLPFWDLVRRSTPC